MDNIAISLNAKGDISTKNLREFLERGCVNHKMRLSSAYSKFDFKINNGMYSSIAENHLAFNRNILESIVKNEDLTLDGLKSIAAIISSDSMYSLKVHNTEALERRGESLNMKPLNMNGFMKSFYGYLGEALPRSVFDGINFINTTRKDILCVTDRFSVSLILINLIHNALIHSRSTDNRVDIVLGRLNRGRMFAVSVVDYGIGVDVGYLKTCIESGVVRRGANRAGIGENKACGLLTSVKLAEMLGGAIIAGNHDGGAVFTLLLDSNARNCGGEQLLDPRFGDYGSVRKMVLSIMSCFN